MEFLQVIMLSTLMVYTAQLPVNGNIHSSRQGNKMRNNTAVLGPLSETPTPKAPQSNGSLGNVALLGATKTQARMATSRNSKTATIKLHFNPSTTNPMTLALSKNAKGNGCHGNAASCSRNILPTIGRSSVKKTTLVGRTSSTPTTQPQNSSSIKGTQNTVAANEPQVKTAMNKTIASRKGKPFRAVAKTNIGITTASVTSTDTNNTNINSSGKTMLSGTSNTGLTTVHNPSNVLNLTSVSIPQTYKYRKFHPCNAIYTSEMKFKVKKIKCRRWSRQELQQRMNCLGTFNHQYLAASIQDAMHFRDLETGKTVNFNRSFVLHPRPVYGYRRKRSLNIDPGQTLVGQCHAKKTVTETGNLRICPVCTAITRQPSQPPRFPEYINELLCDPQMTSPYLPGIDGFCVQKTFTLNLLQFNGEWEMNAELTAEAGYPVYTEKWVEYTQTIRRHCACELLPSSPMAAYL